MAPQHRAWRRLTPRAARPTQCAASFAPPHTRAASLAPLDTRAKRLAPLHTRVPRRSRPCTPRAGRHGAVGRRAAGRHRRRRRREVQGRCQRGDRVVTRHQGGARLRVARVWAHVWRAGRVPCRHPALARRATKHYTHTQQASCMQALRCSRRAQTRRRTRGAAPHRTRARAIRWGTASCTS
jgi:hypothetical protein